MLKSSAAAVCFYKVIINKLNEAVYGYIAQNDPLLIVHSDNNHHDEAKPVGSTDGLLYSYTTYDTGEIRP